MIRIEVPGKPVLVNAISKNSYYAIARELRAWKEDVGWEVKLKRLPPAKTPVVVHIHHKSKAKRLGDAGSCFYAAKAAVDSLVQAGVLPDDSPKYVAGVFFHAPVASDYNALVIELHEPGE